MWIPPNSSDQCCRETVCCITPCAKWPATAGTAFHTLTEDILLMRIVHTQKKGGKATEASDMKGKRWLLSQGRYKLSTRAQNTLKTYIWLKINQQTISICLLSLVVVQTKLISYEPCKKSSFIYGHTFSSPIWHLLLYHCEHQH